MNSSRPLSRRLNQLVMLCGEGECLWDIGCDHGQAGLLAGDSGAFKHICFVDPSEPVIQSLKQLIDSHIPKPFSISIFQERGDQIKVTADQNVFLMAGFGGTAIIDSLKHLASQLSFPSRFVLSPHKNILDVREYLNAGEWHLVTEDCLEEDGQFYELIVVENRHGAKVSLYGEDLWGTPDGIRRRMHLLEKLPHHRSTRDRDFCQFLLNQRFTSKST